MKATTSSPRFDAIIKRFTLPYDLDIYLQAVEEHAKTLEIECAKLEQQNANLRETIRQTGEHYNRVMDERDGLRALLESTQERMIDYRDHYDILRKTLEGTL